MGGRLAVLGLPHPAELSTQPRASSALTPHPGEKRARQRVKPLLLAHLRRGDGRRVHGDSARDLHALQGLRGARRQAG